MSQDTTNPPWGSVEPETYLEEHHNGDVTLYVENSPVVKIETIHGVRQMRWQIYGPCDLHRSVAIMKGFLHLTALLGNEDRAIVRQPAASENDDTTPLEKRKWQTRKTTRRSKP